MSIWSAIFRAKSGKRGHQQVKAAGVLRDAEGWYYEESQNFSSKQSTVRIDQKRPGSWQILASSCGVVGLNKPERQLEVEQYFAGSYRWLQLERDPHRPHGASLIRVNGTYRDKSGKECAVHLGFISRELAKDLESEDVSNLWARIRFIRYPTSGRDSRYLIRFDLMQQVGVRRSAYYGKIKPGKKDNSNF